MFKKNMKFFYSGSVIDTKYANKKESVKHCAKIEKQNNLSRDSVTFSENLNN